MHFVLALFKFRFANRVRRTYTAQTRDREREREMEREMERKRDKKQQDALCTSIVQV